ncbi:MAG TPA: DNA starvation/stationary phase protection protein [Rhodoblastus sp.]|mgnify:CR=1 FL=1|nr:DNA starvation/stationary phase protection protein [Rhodoblastus sp.]
MASATVLQTKPKAEKLSIGIADKARAELANALQECLTGTYRLLVKTQIHHWNVVGPLFHPIHILTDEQYNNLFEAVDTIAERIRALGHLTKSPDLTTEKRQTVEMSAEELIRDLVADHEATCRLMREAAKKADDADDIVTNDMLVQRLTFHEKAIWMLNAIVTK